MSCSGCNGYGIGHESLLSALPSRNVSLASAYTRRSCQPPLLLLGIPSPVAAAVVFVVALQLLIQHSNADYRTGPFKYLLANAEVAGSIIARGAGQGDVKFSLFTTLWVQVLGTFITYRNRSGLMSWESSIDNPIGEAYVTQLLEPFRAHYTVNEG